MVKNWRDVLIRSQTSIVETVEVIDRGVSRIALVVDENDKLIGTVTDGDIRRGIIKRIPLDHPVSTVMNTNPVFLQEGATPKQISDFMNKYEILAVPLVKDGTVVGLERISDVLRQNKLPNTVFLMAGGFGTRLRPLTNDCPKPLLKVGDKPILQTILESFIECGFTNVIISTHYMPEMIRDFFGDGSNWGISIQYVHEEKPLGTAGALGMLPPQSKGHPIIVMNGDILTKVDFADLLKFHVDHKVDMTVCVREYKQTVPYGVITAEGQNVVGIEEKPTQTFFVSAGIYVLNAKVVNSICTGDYIDMPDLIEQEMVSHDSVQMYPIHEYWLDIGKLKDFERAQEDYNTSFVK